MPCLDFWQAEATALENAILAARPQGLCPAPPNHRWAVDLDSQPAYAILRVVRDALDSSIGNAPAPPPPPRHPGGALPSGTILADANAFLAAFGQDETSGSHAQGHNWLNTAVLPPPDPAHAPIPQPAAIAAVDDLLGVVRDALDI